MPTYEEEKKENLAAYERLKDEIQSKYKGQYVAMADGRLVKVSPSFDDAYESVKGHRHALVFPAEGEPIHGPLRVRVCRPGWCMVPEGTVHSIEG